MKETQILFTSTDERFVFKKFCLEEGKLNGGILHESELFDVTSLGKGREPFRPFGICYYNDKILVASNSLIGEYDFATNSFVRILPNTPNFVNTHQIRCFGDDLYICNTAVNALCKYEILTGQVRIFNSVSCKEEKEQLAPSHCREHDRKHLNSVCKYNDTIYVLLHNWSLINSELLAIDENSFSLTNRIEIPGKCCHDVFVDDKNIFTLCTGNGSVLKINKEDNELVISNKVCDNEKFWLRGLKSINDKLIVAISSRRGVQTPFNAFLLLAKENLEIIEQFNIEGVFEITDICN